MMYSRTNAPVPNPAHRLRTRPRRAIPDHQSHHAPRPGERRRSRQERPARSRPDQRRFRPPRSRQGADHQRLQSGVHQPGGAPALASAEHLHEPPGQPRRDPHLSDRRPVRRPEHQVAGSGSGKEAPHQVPSGSRGSGSHRALCFRPQCRRAPRFHQRSRPSPEGPRQLPWQAVRRTGRRGAHGASALHGQR